MKTIPRMNGKSCKPFLELKSLSSMSMFYTGKNDELITYKDRSEKRKNSRMLKNHRTEPYVTHNIQDSLLKTHQPQIHKEESKMAYAAKRVQPKVKIGLTALEIPDSEQSESLRTPDTKKKVVFDLAPAEDSEEDEKDSVIIPQRVDQLIAGDILLKIKHKANFSNPLVCRIWLNTAFAYDRKMKYTLKDVDPVSLRKNDKYDEDFAITLLTEPFCKTCTSQTPMDDFWVSWKTNLEKEIRRWKKIHCIIAKHTSSYKKLLNFKAASEMHFWHSNYNDYEEVLLKNDWYRKQSFRWSKIGWDIAQLIDNSDSEDSQGSGSEMSQNRKEFDNEIFNDNIEMAIDSYNDVQLKKNAKSAAPNVLGEFDFPREMTTKTRTTFEEDPEKIASFRKGERLLKTYRVDMNLLKPEKVVVSTPASDPSKHDSRIRSGETKKMDKLDQNSGGDLFKLDPERNFFDMIHEEHKNSDRRPRNCIVRKKRFKSGGLEEFLSATRPLSGEREKRSSSSNPNNSSKPSEWLEGYDFWDGEKDQL